MMIKLEDGTKVRINGLQLSLPYSGMMEGLPTRAMNEKIIEKSQTSFEKQWGKRKTHVVNPPRSEPQVFGYATLPEKYHKIYKNPEKIPDCMFQIWLSSFVTFDKDDDGTGVVLIFFVDKEAAFGSSIEKLIQGASKTFLWKNIAEGFGF